ncbi:hypothetical protein PanWU01x14_030450 [Parasponia andersonii]|uniref:Uncharacterized protein n=1 Tax=Parasponia andersonii TaxID=3476 RepID=A0A2P5DUS5_PARAD|nr:hypothetical protein PanWU01x14_030450 [Parasponia andersonii]
MRVDLLSLEVGVSKDWCAAARYKANATHKDKEKGRSKHDEEATWTEDGEEGVVRVGISGDEDSWSRVSEMGEQWAR